MAKNDTAVESLENIFSIFRDEDFKNVVRYKWIAAIIVRAVIPEFNNKSLKEIADRFINTKERPAEPNIDILEDELDTFGSETGTKDEKNLLHDTVFEMKTWEGGLAAVSVGTLTTEDTGEVKWDIKEDELKELEEGTEEDEEDNVNDAENTEENIGNTEENNKDAGKKKKKSRRAGEKQLDKKITVNLEMQTTTYRKSLQYDLVSRAIYYGASLLRSTIPAGDTTYDNIHKVYSIWICKETLEDYLQPYEEVTDKYFIHRYGIRRFYDEIKDKVARQEKNSDLIEVILIELPKLRKYLEDNGINIDDQLAENKDTLYTDDLSFLYELMYDKEKLVKHVEETENIKFLRVKKGVEGMIDYEKRLDEVEARCNEEVENIRKGYEEKYAEKSAQLDEKSAQLDEKSAQLDEKSAQLEESYKQKDEEQRKKDEELRLREERLRKAEEALNLK